MSRLNIQNLEDALRQLKLLSDAELELMDRRLSGRSAVRVDDVARLLNEYRLCRALLGNALDQRSRILRLEASERKQKQQQKKK